jgi:hypothetical protein
MLFKDVVTKETFRPLEELMQDEYLSSFNLVGGTALSLLWCILRNISFMKILH